MRCEEVTLHSIKEAKNILRTIKRRKADWIGHIMPRNCLLKCVIEANIGGIQALYRTLWKRLWTCRKTGNKMMLTQFTSLAVGRITQPDGLRVGHQCFTSCHFLFIYSNEV